MTVSRRHFVSGIAAALGYLGTSPEVDLFAQAQGRPATPGGAALEAATKRAPKGGVL